jgi:hypothetical protein
VIEKAKRLAIVLLLMAAGCHRYEVPVGQWLWRIDGAWTRPPNHQDIRIAQATILAFRPDHEYVELHCWVLERADETVYISSNSPRVTVVGRWEQNGSEIKVTCTSVAAGSRYAGSISPFCEPISFRLSGKSVAGNAGGQGDGLYSPVTRLVSPDFESYVKEARSSPTRCPSK